MSLSAMEILGNDIIEYCLKFNVPPRYLFAILEDQKVTPMIRGKAMEYNAYILLDELLPKAAWSVQKLNLNAQSGIHDEDISITHRRTGIILTVECKSMVRGSATTGKRTKRKLRGFSVKCHRSRSNISLVGSSNDRYAEDSFDILITNTSNALFEGNTAGELLEIIHDVSIKKMLYDYYGVGSDDDLKAAGEQDWRFCLPSDIAMDGFIPRNPFVQLEDDADWKPISDLEDILLDVVIKRRKKVQTASRR